MAKAGPSRGDAATAWTQDNNDRRLEWTLRIGAFLCFVGHGAFGIMRKDAWVPYFAVAGAGRELALRLMPVVGSIDILVGCLMLIRPRPIVAYWMVAWAIWTALLRPLSGEPGWEVLERAGNYGVPLAMVVLMVRPSGVGELFGAARLRMASRRALSAAIIVLTGTVSLLLLGHGALGAVGKRGLTTNYASIAPSAAAMLTVYVGWLEIALAVVVSFWRPALLLVAITAWKVATESLFVTAGAPFWEVVERGGSYAAPIALMLALEMRRRRN